MEMTRDQVLSTNTLESLGFELEFKMLKDDPDIWIKYTDAGRLEYRPSDDDGAALYVWSGLGDAEFYGYRIAIRDEGHLLEVAKMLIQSGQEG